jgi:hypothetical protein
MMIEHDVGFWETWDDDLFEAETDEDYHRLERRLAARLDADLDEMVDDLDKPAPAARRRPRRPTLAGAIKEAPKHRAIVTQYPDGRIELRYGEPGAAPPTSNPWDEVLSRDTH